MFFQVSIRNSVVDASEYVSLRMCVHIPLLKESKKIILNNFQFH